MTLWSNADAYEQFMGRWSRMLAREVAGLAARPGGAAVVRRVRRRGVDERGAGHQETALGARDRPVGGVRGGAALRPDSQATFRVASAQSIPLDDASVDVSVAGLSLNFTPDPVRALSEMGRVTRAGGTVAAYVWDYSGGMQMSAAFWGAATELDVGAPAETTRAGCRPEGLRQQFDDAGLTRSPSKASCCR